MVHIPYGGAAPAVVDLLAGNVDMGFLNAPPLMAHFASGDLTALAIASPDRSPQLPDVPTMQEAGFAEFDMATWYGISAPAGTPAEAVAKLDAAIAETLKDPEVTEKLTNLGVVVFYKTSADFGAFLAKDEGRMIDLLATAGVKKQ
jgi:tripartite-type tricarboxylate transporter receptor subunit TctC